MHTTGYAMTKSYRNAVPGTHDVDEAVWTGCDLDTIGIESSGSKPPDIS